MRYHVTRSLSAVFGLLLILCARSSGTTPVPCDNECKMVNIFKLSDYSDGICLVYSFNICQKCVVSGGCDGGLAGELFHPQWHNSGSGL